MDRRAFLTKAGLGSMTLASLGALADTFSPSAWAAGERSFQFMCFSVAGPAGTPASPQHRMAMGGQGRFDPARGGSQANGGGVFTHHLFPGANPPPGGTPLPVVASGTWKARQMVGYKEVGTWGVLAAGTVDLVIDMSGEIPSRAVIRGSVLRIICNIGPAGLVVPGGETEGFKLSIPGTEFSAGGTPGPFVPLFFPGTPVPSLGITIFSTVASPS